MGKSALSSSSPRAKEQGRGRRVAGGTRAAALGLGSGQEEGEKRERGSRGSIPPLDFGEGGPQGGNPWRLAAVGGGGHGGTAVGLDSGQGEEGE